MKKVLFVRKSNPQIGGVEMQMLRIALWLRDRKQTQSSLATDDLNGALAKLFLSNGFEVYHCSLSGTFYLLKAVTQLSKIMNTHQISFLQAHMFRESIVCRLVKWYRPSVTHIFRIETYIDCSSISDFKKKLYHRLAKLTGSLVDHYLANGNLVAKELAFKSGLEKHRIEVVFNGVEQFGIPDRQPLTLDSEGFLHVAMVANFVRGKGHEVLFDAIAASGKQGVKIKAFLFGDAMEDAGNGGKSYKQELMELASALGIADRIVFRGFSYNLVEDLTEFKVVLLPSYSEGTPNTILEAMSARKLVIASDAGELAYMIENGVSGFVHKTGDAAKLTEILKHVFRNESASFESIRENGFNRWKSIFSLDGMMNKIVKVYESK